MSQLICHFDSIVYVKRHNTFETFANLNQINFPIKIFRSWFSNILLYSNQIFKRVEIKKNLWKNFLNHFENCEYLVR